MKNKNTLLPEQFQNKIIQWKTKIPYYRNSSKIKKYNEKQKYLTTGIVLKSDNTMKNKNTLLPEQFQNKIIQWKTKILYYRNSSKIK